MIAIQEPINLLAISNSITSLEAKESEQIVQAQAKKAPVDISLEKYQFAVDFYSVNPNTEMHKSYSKSLDICKILKSEFKRSKEIAKKTIKAKKKGLSSI